MNKRQFILTHLPSLLQNIAKNSVEHDFNWMVAVKVDLHVFPPGSLGPRSKQGVIRKSGITGQLLTLSGAEPATNSSIECR
jgi:hypothetical protein